MMGGAPVIIWIRPGVGFVQPAADSFRRLEARLGRQADVNSTYRPWDTQLGMYHAWQAWIKGTGPKPPHSRAVHPKYSIHCQGRAWDSDDWRTPGFIALAAEYGFIRTAASDPTEQHHFEYIASRDRHRHEPVPSATKPAPASPKPRPAPQPEPPREPILEDLMALKNVTLAVQKKENVDNYDAVTLDFETGLRTPVTYYLSYVHATAKALTGQEALIVTASHRDVLVKEFDAHFAKKREHELAVARAGAPKIA